MNQHHHIIWMLSRNKNPSQGTKVMVCTMQWIHHHVLHSHASLCTPHIQIHCYNPHSHFSFVLFGVEVLKLLDFILSKLFSISISSINLSMFFLYSDINFFNTIHLVSEWTEGIKTVFELTGWRLLMLKFAAKRSKGQDF